jgi:hypothetical protein
MDPDPSIIKQKSKKNLNSYSMVTFFDFLSSKNDVNVPSKVTSKNFFLIIFFCVSKVNDENRRIWIRWSEAWIRGSGSTPKCHGSATLLSHLGSSAAAPLELLGKDGLPQAEEGGDHRRTGHQMIRVHHQHTTTRNIFFRTKNDKNFEFKAIISSDHSFMKLSCTMHSCNFCKVNILSLYSAT